MKIKNLLTLTAITLLTFTGCKNSSVDSLTKLKTTCNAAIKKVDAFNKTVSQALPPQTSEINTQNKDFNESNDITALYGNGTDYNYCEEQCFGLYIFNNVYYCLQSYYDNSNIKIGDVIKGETRKLPDKQLQKFYDDKALSLPTPVLSLKCEVEGDEENYIVSFQANWDFRNNYFKDNIPYLNTVISTNGVINYSKNKDVKNITLNYYWTGINRIMASYNLNYETNKFSCIAFSNNDKNLGWEYQEDPTATLINYWNEGNLTAEKVKKLNYHYMYMYSGDISNDVKALNLKSKTRYVSYFAKEEKVVEDETGKDDFDNLFNSEYQNNKSVTIKGDKDLLDLTQAKTVDMDKCVKYGESKTKIFWIYDEQANDSKSYTVGVNPYQNKTELASIFRKLKDKGVNDKQKTLLETAASYLDTLKESEYFGEFKDEVNGVSYQYDYTGKETARNNVIEATYLTFKLIDLKDSGTYVKFIVTDGEPILNGKYGK